MTKELVNENVAKQNGSRDAIPAPPNCPSCGRGSGCVSEASYNHRGGVFGMNNRNGNPPTLTLPLKGGREQVSNYSGIPQSLIHDKNLTSYRLNVLTTSKKAAFTLAEVLVTLGVIGVVAAMTIPALVQNYQKKVIATTVKKTYAELNQVIKLSEIDNGPFNTWTLLDVKGSIEQSRLAFNKYFAPYMSGVTEYSTGMDEAFGVPVSVHGVNYILKNGVGLSFKSGSRKIWFTIIVNPNKNSVLGREAFYFYIVDGKILPVGWYAGLTRDEIFNGYSVECSGSICNYKCGKTIKDVTDENGEVTTYSRHGCTPLFYIDGFEFKDDYPW